MLEKHKYLIENNILNNNFTNKSYSMSNLNNYSFEVFENELVINIDENISLRNIDDGTVSIWHIKEKHNQLSIILNRVDSFDVVAMIAVIDCNNKIVNATMKQTPTNLYISYGNIVSSYDINKCNTDLIINIIEDYFNKKKLLINKNKGDIFRFIKVDIDEIFNTIYNNKNNYISNLKHQLNNLNANYVMESEKIKEKLKRIDTIKK